MRTNNTNSVTKRNKSLTRFTGKVFWRYPFVLVGLLGIKQYNSRSHLSEMCVRIYSLVLASGFDFTVQYLKESLRLSMKALAGEPTQSSQEPRVAVRRGLPLIIPGGLRLLMEAKDAKIIKAVLTILSLYRVMPASPKWKLETITSPFNGVYKTTPEITSMLSLLKSRYSIPEYFSYRDSIFEKGRKLLTLTTAGPNVSNQIFGYFRDARAFLENPDLLESYRVFAMNTDSKSLYKALVKDIKHLTTAEQQVKGESLGATSGVTTFCGKLSCKEEPAGKVRIFAILDAWTQSLLYPLHEALFEILKQIPSDGTFNQLKPVEKLLSRGLKELYSFDLSAATDRLPIELQKDILSTLFDNPLVGQSWRDLLVNRSYRLETQTSSHDLRYSVGQPMGALSSGGMLALTHHLIIQAAAKRTGITTGFEDYAVLGDDVVIANAQVAVAYQVLMKDLGVDINLSKSLSSSIGVCEFAKKLLTLEGDGSPLGPKSLFEFINSPSKFKDIFINYNLGLEAILKLPRLDLNEEDHEFEISGRAALVKQLTVLFKDLDRFGSKRGTRKIKAQYGDLVSCFGLNIIQDLSPSLTEKAINSLGDDDFSRFFLFLEKGLDKKINRNWFKDLETEVNNYNKHRRGWSTEPIGAVDYPSSEHLLDTLSSLLESTSYKSDVPRLEKLTMQEKLKYAFSTRVKIPAELVSDHTKPKATRTTVKALELSRELLRELAQTDPKLYITIMSKGSQAVRPLS